MATPALKFHELPPDIHNIILRYLFFPHVLSLLATCKGLQHLETPPVPKPSLLPLVNLLSLQPPAISFHPLPLADDGPQSFAQTSQASIVIVDKYDFVTETSLSSHCAEAAFQNIPLPSQNNHLAEDTDEGLWPLETKGNHILTCRHIASTDTTHFTVFRINPNLTPGQYGIYETCKNQYYTVPSTHDKHVAKHLQIPLFPNLCDIDCQGAFCYVVASLPPLSFESSHEVGIYPLRDIHDNVDKLPADPPARITACGPIVLLALTHTTPNHLLLTTTTGYLEIWCLEGPEPARVVHVSTVSLCPGTVTSIIPPTKESIMTHGFMVTHNDTSPHRAQSSSFACTHVLPDVFDAGKATTTRTLTTQQTEVGVEFTGDLLFLFGQSKNNEVLKVRVYHVVATAFDADASGCFVTCRGGVPGISYVRCLESRWFRGAANRFLSTRAEWSFGRLVCNDEDRGVVVFDFRERSDK